MQHPRHPCPSLSPGACSNSCPLSQWCHPTISSSVIPFSGLLSFPASGSFLMSQLFTSGSQSIGASASASVLPMNIQDWFPLGLTDWISLQSKGLLRLFSNTTIQKHQADCVSVSQFSSVQSLSRVRLFATPWIAAHESLAPKNWCFWTVVLEKTLESPLDGKGIKPVNPKGN